MVKHKSDTRMENWTVCGLTSHFEEYHRGDREEAISNLKVTLVDCVSEVGELKKREEACIYNLGTLFISANSKSEVLLTRGSILLLEGGLKKLLPLVVKLFFLLHNSWRQNFFFRVQRYVTSCLSLFIII